MIGPSMKKCLWISTIVILLALNLDLLLFSYNNGTFIFPQKVVLFLNKNISRRPPIKMYSYNFTQSVIEKSLFKNSSTVNSSKENSSKGNSSKEIESSSVVISKVIEAIKKSSK